MVGMAALILWFLFGLILSAFAAFAASHYYRPTLREQAVRWLVPYAAVFIGLVAVPDASRRAFLGPLAWVFSTRTALSDTAPALAVCWGLFALWLLYFIPSYQRLGIGDAQGTIRTVLFPFRAAAITFDDGPSPEWTPKILDLLDRHRVKATFFLVGTAVERYPDIVADIARRGHSVGSHGWSHRPLPLLDATTLVQEIDRAADALEKALGQRPRYFRPPWGFYNRRVLDELRARGYLTVLWTKSSQDWRNPGADEIERLAAGDPQMGDILLFHDGGNYPSKEMPTTSRADTVAGLDRVIPRLEGNGFQIKSLDEMVAGWVS